MKYLLILLLLLAGCTHRPAGLHAPTGLTIIDVEPEFNVCEPVRGWDQDEVRWSKGGLNDLPHGCI